MAEMTKNNFLLAVKEKNQGMAAAAAKISDVSSYLGGGKANFAATPSVEQVAKV